MKPLKIYAENIEKTALDQFYSAMEQDFVVKGALMADAHTGYSLPIGGVVAAQDVIVPAYCGFDLGCGLSASSTCFDVNEIKENKEAIFNDIYKTIPMGFSVHPKPTKTDLDINELTKEAQEVFHNRRGFKGLGTLGGGNHFIEIGYDENENIWIIIHSGSRGVGHGIATYYMRQASGDGKAREGHFGFRTDSDIGKSYINDLNWCLEFALENRKRITAQVSSILKKYCYGYFEKHFINRNHNHVEEKDGLWIHRKGATHAEKGMEGVIPGNMRDGSFIVEGKGDPESLWSSSHGAGRVMGRKQAKRELDKEKFIDTMQGVTAKVNEDTLDESPFAYKDIFEVMNLQKDLVNIKNYIKPIINIKA